LLLQQPDRIAAVTRYPWHMAKVIEKRPDGTTVIIVPAAAACRNRSRC
jgi:hypothetical protein